MVELGNMLKVVGSSDVSTVTDELETCPNSKDYFFFNHPTILSGSSAEKEKKYVVRNCYFFQIC